MHASRFEYIDIMSYLIEQGCNLNLQECVSQQLPCIVFQLTFDGCAWSPQNGYTALMQAIEASKCKSVQCLLEHGADVFLQNKVMFKW